METPATYTELCEVVRNETVYMIIDRIDAVLDDSLLLLKELVNALRDDHDR